MLQLPIHQHLATELDNRLLLLKHQPSHIIIHGADAGNSSRLLTQRYPKAIIHQYDERQQWLEQDKANTPNSLLKKLTQKGITRHQQTWQQQLPNNQADMLWANLSLLQTQAIIPTIENWANALKPHGTLFFTHLGGDSLPEIKTILQANNIDTTNQILIDMHDIADMLHHHGFYDPVVDTAKLILNYQTAQTLIEDLKHLGILPIFSQKQTDITQLIQAAFLSGSLKEITLETIYGHAIRKQPVANQEQIIKFYRK